MEKRSVLGIIAGLISISMVSAAWSFTDVLNYWNTMGVFTYVLPFLLVFAIVFGVITKTNILGENRAVHAIIALAIGLLSLVGDYVPRFFQTLAPNLGVGLSILLAGIILLGLFVQEKKTEWVQYILVGVGIAVFIVVAYSSLNDVGFSGNLMWQQYAPALVTLAIIVGAIALIVKMGTKKGP